MAGCIVEIKDEISEVFDRLTPHECIYNAPDKERNQDSGRSAADEFTGGVVKRKLEIAGSYDEKRYAGANDRVKERRPESIRFCQNLCAFAAKVERLSTMDEEHHKTC